MRSARTTAVGSRSTVSRARNHPRPFTTCAWRNTIHTSSATRSGGSRSGRITPKGSARNCATQRQDVLYPTPRIRRPPTSLRMPIAARHGSRLHKTRIRGSHQRNVQKLRLAVGAGRGNQTSSTRWKRWNCHMSQLRSGTAASKSYPCGPGNTLPVISTAGSRTETKVINARYPRA